MESEINLKVNGESFRLVTDVSAPLLYVLRNELKLTGPKYGCGLSQCGACMALVDGEAMPTCRTPVSAVADREIVTIEGLGDTQGNLHPVQKAFVEKQAAQCGFCVNGMIIGAVALLRKTPKPSRDQIIEGMSQSLCRCGTYTRFIDAVESAAEAGGEG